MPRFRAHAACQDFHRASEAARRDVLTRRQMLKWGIGAGVTVYAANMLPTAHLLDAAAAEAAAAPDAPILVSVFLPGGLDLLDTLMPLRAGGRAARSAQRRVAGGAAGAGRHLARACTRRSRAGRAAASRVSTTAGRSASCRASTTPTPTCRTSPRARSGRRAWSPSSRSRAGSAAGWIATAAPTTRCRG